MIFRQPARLQFINIRKITVLILIFHNLFAAENIGFVPVTEILHILQPNARQREKKAAGKVVPLEAAATTERLIIPPVSVLPLILN